MRSLIRYLCLAALISPHATMADDVRYEAVWHSGERASLTTAPLSRSAFLETGEALIDSGMRLFDVETRIIDGQRRYAGLWTQGTGGNIFAGPMGSLAMRNAIEERQAQGLRLIDFEIFRTGSGGRRYVGVWRQGPGREILTGPMEFDAFVARGESFVNDGFRLWDVEVERINGTLLYSGLFRTGGGSNQIIGPISRLQFRVRRNQMVADGLELRDIERVEVNGVQRFVTVWSSGDGESRFSRQRSFPEHFIFSQDQFNDGQRALDFEIRVIADEPDGNGGGNGGNNGGGGGPGPSPVNDLPPNPPYVELVDGRNFRIDWSNPVGNMPTIEVPRAYLPDHLPIKDGEKLLPTGSVCGFVLIKATNAFWQIPGDPDFTQPPFNAVENVQVEDFPSFTNGIDLWGPILGCDGTDQQWNFPLPLTTQGPFNPQNVPNLSLVIQMDPPSPGIHPPRIEFTPPFPDAEPADVDELWDDEWIEDLIEWANDMIETGNLSGEYCGVSSLIVELCEQEPGICPAPDPQGNC